MYIIYSWLPRQCLFLILLCQILLNADCLRHDRVELLLKKDLNHQCQKCVMIKNNLSPYICSCHIIVNSKPKSISFCQFKATSILKVLLTQYKSLTDPNKFSRGITPTKADQRGLKTTSL